VKIDRFMSLTTHESPRGSRVTAAARDVLRGNDAGRYTVSSRTTYPHQWNWDSDLHGEDRAARTLVGRMLGAIDGGGMREYFAPESGRGLGAKDFAWTAALCLRTDRARLIVPART
jgi:hypothetical protein